jgi:hypothetical protein
MWTHWFQRKDGGHRGNQWDEYPTENLKAIRNFAHPFTCIAILELGAVLSPNSDIVAKKTHFSWPIIESDKFA